MKPSTPTLFLSLAAALSASLTACVTSEPRKGRGGGGGECNEVEENVVIRTQADFDELPDGCWDLYGKLSIEGSDITSLAKLGKLEGVNEIEIVGTNLTTLDSPQKLNVYGPVTVTSNDKLTKLDNMVVERADNLTMEITIDDNAVLTTVGDMSRVDRVDGDLTVTSNSLLRKVELRGLKQIDGAVHVNDNVALTTLDLSKVSTVGNVHVNDNAALTTLDLSKVSTVGNLEIMNNAALGSLSSMAASTIKGDVTVRGNKALTSFGTMNSLTTIEGSLRIEDNDALTTIGAFTSSMQVALGMVRISGNATLAELGQVGHFRKIGSLDITDNPALSFCKAREVALCVEIAGSITVQNNKVGTNCTSWCGR